MRIEPAAFIAIEKSMVAAMKAGWDKLASKILDEIRLTIEAKDWAAAETLANQLTLTGVVAGVRPKLEELGVSALLFGAHRVTGSVKATSFMKGRRLPGEIHGALAQLEHAIEHDAADQIRKRLHSAIAKLKRQDERAHLQKENHFHDQYGRFTSAGSTLAGLGEQLRSGASINEMLRHPALKSAVKVIDKFPETSLDPRWGDHPLVPSQDWQDNRTFVFNGKEVKGYEAGVSKLNDKAESYSTKGPVKAEKQGYIVLGPPASGKSTVAEGLAEDTRSAIVDSDDAKAALPEFKGGLGANAVLTESQYLSTNVLKDQLSKAHNVVYPTVGCNPDKISKMIGQLKAAGYDVHLVNLAVEPENYMRRMIGRFVSTGRVIPPAYMSSIDHKPEKTYEQLKDDPRLTSHAELDGNGPKGSAPPITGEGQVAEVLRAKLGRVGKYAGGVRRPGPVVAAKHDIYLESAITKLKRQDEWSHLQKYDADQPRDDHGKWSASFGSSAKKNIAEAIRVAEKNGFPVHEWRKPGSLSAAIYSSSQDKAFINFSHKHWKDPVGSQKWSFESGQLSTDHPMHAIVHELGHAKFDPPDNWLTIGHQDVAGNVSKYARVNPKEFVSEVYAGHELGRAFPEDVEKLFSMYARERKRAHDIYTESDKRPDYQTAEEPDIEPDKDGEEMRRLERELGRAGVQQKADISTDDLAATGGLQEPEQGERKKKFKLAKSGWQGVIKYNENHDERGRFASGSGNGTISDKNGDKYAVRHESLYEGSVNDYHVYNAAGEAVAYARVKYRDAGPKVTSLGVREGDRRKGIAAALYNHIESHIGEPLSPEEIQTDEGKALWEGRRNRGDTSKFTKCDRLKRLEPKAEFSLADQLNNAVLKGGSVAIDTSAALTTSRLVTLGFLTEAQQQGVGKYRVDEVLDDKTCPFCMEMNGKIFDVSPQIARTFQALGTSDPADLQDLAPWPESMDDLAGKDNGQLQGEGYGAPPYHPGCRGMLSLVEGDLQATATDEANNGEEDDLGAEGGDGSPEGTQSDWTDLDIEQLGWDRFQVTDPAVFKDVDAAFEAGDYDHAQALIEDWKSQHIAKEDQFEGPNQPKKKRKLQTPAGRETDYDDIASDSSSIAFDSGIDPGVMNDYSAPIDR